MPQLIVYPPALVDHLLGIMSMLESEESTPSAPPSRGVLELMLDTAWAATLLEEEGRRPVFTLGYASEEQARAAPCHVLAFTQPTPCDPRAIAKLALATDPRETIIAVRANGGRLEIWGLLQLGERDIGGVHPARPGFLHVTGFRPSCLVVESHARRLLLYMNGVAHWYERGSENITSLLQHALHPTARTLGSSGDVLGREFERLADSLVLAGHGGTLLIAEGGQPRGVHLPPTSTFRSPNTGLKDSFLRGESYLKGTAAARGPATYYDVKRAHGRALDHVARLSNVDGAVVMGPDLTVFGFGATIDLTDETAIPPMVLHDLTTSGTPTRSITVSEFVGHRHKSAVHFCAMQSSSSVALAIVAAHDGVLSLFGRTGSDIAVYTPFILRSVSVR